MWESALIFRSREASQAFPFFPALAVGPFEEGQCGFIRFHLPDLGAESIDQITVMGDQRIVPR